MLLASILLAATLSSTDGYVLLMPHDHLVENGSFTVEEVAAIREAYGANVFVFRKHGRDYVVRDRATVNTIADLFRPQSELGRKQAELGAKQAQLGAEQARLGAEQANASAERQNRLAREQDALTRKQNALGREQDRLGREQDAMARKADQTVRTMIDEMIRRGIAQPYGGGGRP
jgi:hypothetical protein